MSRTFSSDKSNRTGIVWGLLAGMPIGGVFLLLTQLDRKWFIFLFVAILLLVSSLAFPNRKSYYLSLLTLSISIGVNLTLCFTPSSVYRSTFGFLINLGHIPLAVLLLIHMHHRTASFDRPLARSGTGLLLSLTAFFVACSISTIQADEQLFALMDLYALATSMVLFIYIAGSAIAEDELRLIVYVLLLTVGFQASLALVQYTTNLSTSFEFLGMRKNLQSAAGAVVVSRAGGTLGHPNSLAFYFDLLLPLNFSLLFAPIRGRARLFLTATLLLGLAGLSATLSRGGMLATAMSLFLVLLIHWGRRIGRVRVIFALMFLLIVVLAPLLTTSNPIEKRFFQKDYGNTSGRIDLIHVVFRLIKLSPFFGVGLNNYTPKAMIVDYTPSQIVSSWNAPVHNLLLFIAGETGLIGASLFIFFVLMVIRALKPSLQTDDAFLFHVGTGLLLGLCAYATHTIADYNNWTHFLPLWFLLGLAAAVGRIAAVRALPAQGGVERHVQRSSAASTWTGSSS